MIDRFTVADLMHRANYDVVLGNIVAALNNGYFDSFDEFLITAVCKLVDDRCVLVTELARVISETTIGFTVCKTKPTVED